MPLVHHLRAMPTLWLLAIVPGGCAADGPPDAGPGRQAHRLPGHGDGAGGLAAGGPRSLFVSPSGEPFRAAPGEPYPVVRWFAQADAARDGRLDAAEFRADVERFFNALDVDHDGVIDASEVARYERDLVPEVLAGANRFSMVEGLRGPLRRVAALDLAQPGGGFPGGGGSGGGGGGGDRRGSRQSEDSSPRKERLPAMTTWRARRLTVCCGSRSRSPRPT